MYKAGDAIFDSGGEGIVYKVEGHPNLLYKEYKPGRMNLALANKLRYMPSNRPVISDGNSNFAWPESLAEDPNGQPLGFIMPLLKFDFKLDSVYEYIRPWRLPLNYCMKDLYKSRIVVARNVCVMVHIAHENKIVIGDFNHNNMGVHRNTGFVSMFDCDSFHLNNGQYRCCVGMPGYIAPELLKHLLGGTTNDYARAQLPTFTVETDLFALGVHIFRLLMNGVNPFNGIDTSLKSSSASVGAGDEPIIKGRYCFKGSLLRFLYKPKSPLVPPIHILTDTLKDYFHRTFVGPKENRPSPGDWIYALDTYRGYLKQCNSSIAHWYHRGLTKCPWCEADSRQKAVDENRTKPNFTIKRIPSMLHEFR